MMNCCENRNSSANTNTNTNTANATTSFAMFLASHTNLRLNVIIFTSRQENQRQWFWTGLIA